MKKRHAHTFSTIGFSSILIIFMSVAILTFSVLSMMTASADYRLSKKVAEKTSDYYLASNEAEIILQEIDSALLTLYQNTSSNTEFVSGIETALSDIPNLTITLNETACIAEYYVTINDIQSLYVKCTLHYPTTQTQRFYTLQEWKTVGSFSEEDTDQSLNVLGSE